MSLCGFSFTQPPRTYIKLPATHAAWPSNAGGRTRHCTRVHFRESKNNNSPWSELARKTCCNKSSFVESLLAGYYVTDYAAFVALDNMNEGQWTPCSAGAFEAVTCHASIANNARFISILKPEGIYFNSHSYWWNLRETQINKVGGRCHLHIIPDN